MESPYFLELSPNPIRFEPVSKLTNVFFDDANRQVFAVRSGGATGVVVKGPDDRTNAHFRMEDKGVVISIKFSPDQKVLAIQRCQKSVEFVNFTGKEIDTLEYSQSCKGKATKILGFVWTCVNEITFVTDHGIELYQVISEKRSLKSVKTVNIPVNWFVYQPESSLLLISSGTMGNIMNPFQFKPGAVFRLPKFEVDLPVVPKPPKLSLLERDVTLETIYQKICVIVLRHQPRTSGGGGAEIVLYSLQKDGPPRKTDILKLDMSGRFAVHVVDDLVVVHHQASKTSMLFDIRLPGDSDGFVTYHVPVVRPCPIKPFVLKLSSVPPHMSFDGDEQVCDLYSPNWVVFQPNIIIDAKLGCLWYVQLQLEPIINMIDNKCLLVDFLLLRQNSKSVLLEVCKNVVLSRREDTLSLLSKIFDKLNLVCKKHIERQSVVAGAQLSIMPKPVIVCDQSDMYTVFSVFEVSEDSNYKYIVAILVEYIRSLTQYQLPVQHFLHELLINHLVQHRCFYQLHQFLQYQILTDSKPLACLLLSLQNLYPASDQLALDMLKRLGKANEEIVEILLSKQQIISALRFIRNCGNIDTVSARKFLHAAKNTNDPSTFYAVYKFFEQRNIRLRGLPQFEPGEHCDLYTKHFEMLFGSSQTS
ncbi:uncharacterized protein C18orf8 homolog [Centruroides sculpturatus]|uniref:uncharacterized protein C18orf8 homolog n=1 Tax=Centruroides sculpturatus TaxID=218467 RepID=UPI000C6E4CDB|nr:uncharacterized protein C18orf8 homolog [Centruroides sculpturatus]